MTNQKLFISIVGLMGVLTPSVQALPRWPDVANISSSLSIYQDFNNEKQFYYIPKGIQVAKTEDAVNMISHGIFFNRLKPSATVTQYNLTFEPILNGGAVQSALEAIKHRYHYGDDASLTPLPITTASFEVTQKLTENGQISNPFTVTVPSWTGDLHSFYQRFSVIMKGNAYASEPAMSRFMTNSAGNAFVGTMHYGFRGVSTPFDGYAKINVSQFMSKFRAHASAKFGFWGSVDIATAIDKIKDDKTVFFEVVKDVGYESESWKAITDKLVSILFQPVPQAPDAATGSGSGLFQISSSYSTVTKDQTILVTVKESLIKDHSGDIDVVGGGISFDNLDSNIKYFCEMWARYNTTRQACENVCEPAVEYYNPSKKTCSPAFGSGT